MLAENLVDSKKSPQSIQHRNICGESSQHIDSGSKEHAESYVGKGPLMKTFGIY